MNNNFTEQTKELFGLGNYCMDWEDGQNDADCLHHIIGRESNSPYNAAPLANFRNHWPEYRSSHNLPHINSEYVIIKYLKKTKKYLDSIKYKPTKKDLEFLEKYKDYYK